MIELFLATIIGAAVFSFLVGYGLGHANGRATATERANRHLRARIDAYETSPW